MEKNKEVANSSCNESKGVGRRDFISRSILLGTGLVAAQIAGASKVASANNNNNVRNQNNHGVPAKRKLGSLEVSAIGLGCMSMTSGHYNPPRDIDEMVPVIRGAVDQGVTFFDTAEYYGPFSNEVLVGKALAPVRNQVVIATKFGFQFENEKPVGRNSRPEHIRKAVEGMLQRLQTDRVDLLYLHRLDPNVAVEDVAGTVSDLIKEGKVLHFGLSEVSPQTLRRAHAVLPVTALQSEYSLIQRLHENQVLDTCEELGIGFVPWGPVCRGFLADKFNEYSRFSEESRHSEVPYFTPEALQVNMEILDLVRDFGRRKGVSPAEFSLAWLLAQKPFIVPIPGTTKLHHMKENIGALDVKFSQEELKEFREAFSKIGLVGVRPSESALTDL
jgi:aryl-alcohol dehydrogenase-like predicted oxidoreductase